MAIGFLEVAGYGTALYAADKACKTADISILGVDVINPKNASMPIPLTVQVKFEGNVSDVSIAIEVAEREALKFNTQSEITTSVIDNPYKGTKKLSEISKIKVGDEKPFGAIGIVDITFLTNAIVALDEMLKTSDVKLVGYEKKLGGKLVTIIIEGAVSAVEMAVARVQEMPFKDKPIKLAVTISRPHPEITKLLQI